MVSFKTNNVTSSDQLSTPPQHHRHLAVSARSSVVQFPLQQQHQLNCSVGVAEGSTHPVGGLVHPHLHHQQQQQLQHRHEPPASGRESPFTAATNERNSCCNPASNDGCPQRLDQPVTNSSSGMDTKKIVQNTTTTPVTAAQPHPQHQQQQCSQQPRGKGGGASVTDGPSMSGVRRRSGPQQGLRSPAAKRPVSAPVALQGWLHKQGSEGLMLWKKRWFVLSEYCLFYYKGPEEEKLLGSILLPSYRVTVCRPEDKVTKKFAFKAEHANMRTYNFAAETRESMNQWVSALTLASLLQDPNPGGGGADVVAVDGSAVGPQQQQQQGDDRSARPSVSSISSIMNQSADDSDSGFHGFQSRDDPSHASNNNSSSPNSVNTGSFPSNTSTNKMNNNLNALNNNNNNNNSEQPQPLINGWMQSPQYRQSPYNHQMQPIYQQHPHLAQQQQQQQQQQIYNKHSPPQQGAGNVHTVQPMPRNYGQPVYANAPPKPKRLNENPSDSPDPDYRKSPVSPDVRLSTKSPMTVVEYLDARNPNAIYGQRIPVQPNLRTDKSGLTYGYTQPQPAERRTPDTYGRSSAKPLSRQQMRNGQDYEDVYSNPPPQLYQRPAGPVGYTKGPAPTPIPIPLYTQQHQQQQQQQMHPQYYVVSGHTPNGELTHISRQQQHHQQQQRPQQPPRPHSADFLEYESRSTRPDPQTPTQSGVSVMGQPRCPQRPKSSLDIVNPSDIPSPNDNYFYSEERYAAQMRQSAVYLHQPPPPAQQAPQAPVQQQQSRNQSLSRATTPSKSTASRGDTESGIGTLSEMSGSSSVRRSQREHHHHSLQRHTELTTSEVAHMRRSLRETRAPPPLHHHESAQHSPGRSLPRDYGHVSTASGGQGGRRWDHQQQQQFARSASARLPRTRHPAAIIDYDDDEDDDEESYGDRSSGQGARDGERKIQQREESMKRLLEWKQRMLQSPLTRKPASSSNGTNQRNLHNADLANCYKQQALLELAAHEASLAEQNSSHRHRRRDDAHHRSHYPRSKSTDARRSGPGAMMSGGVGHHNVLPRYSSYSSDDEELSDVRPKRTRRPPQSGRSPRSFEKEQQTPLQQQSPASTINHHQPAKQQPPPVMRRPGSSIDFATSTTPREVVFEEMSFSRPQSKLDCPVKEVKPMRHTPDKITPPKKPLGILKTPGVYSSNTNPRNEAKTGGYSSSDSWPTQKNVQWVSHKDDEKEDWDSKIDESKVIKEFSYQYIRQDDNKDKSMETPKKVDSVNLVKSRIRSFESNLDPEVVAAEEMAQSDVALATRLMESPRKIREFVLGDERSQDEQSEDDEEAKNKSVKDLLADFERKSQQVHQQEHESKQQKEMKHRGVFSDTETLLYETGSDLDQPEKSCDETEELEQIVPKYKNQPEEKSREIQHNKYNDTRKSPPRDRSHEVDVNETINPAFTRLSVTESLVTHGDRLSAESDETSPLPKQTVDPNLEEHYLPMTPRKAILDLNDDRPMPKMMQNLFRGLNEESSYVEMERDAVSRALLSPNSKMQDFGDYATMDNQHYEFVCVSNNKMEPVYMEVSQLAEKNDNNSSLKASPNNKEVTGGETPNSRGDLPDILTALKSDSSDADDESSKDLDSIDTPRHPRFSLSDTFRPASYYLGASQTLIAELHDSSDSELVSPPPIPTSPPPMDDLDSLEMHDSLEIKKIGTQVAQARDYNSHRDSPKSWNKPAAQVEVRRSSPSRYSESTFHDSRMSLESASGSDSVELRNSEEEARHRQMKRRPVSDDMCEVLDSLDELESLGSRFDGASIDLDQYLEELQSRDAFNVDLYTKDLSYNSIYGLNENMLVADKLQKFAYPEIAKTTGATESNASLDQPYQYNSKSKTSSASSLPSMRVSETPPKVSHQHSQSLTGDAHYENISKFSPLRGSPAVVMARSDGEISQLPEHSYKTPSKTVPSPLANIVATHSRDSSYSYVSGTASVANYSAQRPASAQSSTIHSPTANLQSTNTYITAPQQQPQYHSRSASQDSAHYSLSPNHRSSSSQDSSQYPASTSTVVRTTTSSQNHGDQSGAPYYYSDLQTANMIAERNENQNHQRPCPVTSNSRLSQLNNQRGDAQLNKRNDIGRMVNPIQRQMPRQIQVDDIEEARRIAAELRKTTCQLLAEDKAALVDRRNFYEADTLRRVKSTDPMPDAPVNVLEARNLYPHGLKDKSGSQTQLNAADSSSGNEFPSTTQTSHRRSRSLEGLLDDVGLQNMVEQRNRTNRQQAVITAQQAQSQPEQQEQEQHSVSREIEDSGVGSSNNTFGGEDPWEQDNLWRESLRRVSIRHARSLDNLDAPSPTVVSRNSSETPKSRAKITRGVTYVNDSVANTAERPRVKRRSDENETTTQESVNDPNERTSPHRNKNNEDAGVYAWDSQNEAYRGKPETTNSINNQSSRHFLVEGNPVPAQQPTAADTAVEATTATTTTNSGSSSFELDREKLRQWDLLSSACLLQEQQALQAADGCRLPGRGLPQGIAQSAAVTGCASVADALSRKSPLSSTKTMTTTTMSSCDDVIKLQQQQQHQRQRAEDEEVKDLVAHSNGTTASGSGSVIGRDPLPPRAVSTSQLVQQQQQVESPPQPNGCSSTLPRSIVAGAAPHQHHRQQQQKMMVSGGHRNHQQHQQSTPHIACANGGGLMQQHQESDYANHILKAASSGDVRMLNELRDPRIASSTSGQRHLVSPTNHLRVISPVDHLHRSQNNQHRVSSPSDSERQHAQSLSDRGCSMSSPIIGRDSELRASNPSLRQMPRNSSSGRHSGDQLVHKRSQSAQRSRSSGRLSSIGGGSTSSLVQVSAGELLNRTHEELVLLLIQLRRQSATLCKAMETCHMEIEAQARLVELDTPRRLENLQKLDELKKHLMDLEKQYEKGKPLVNLVDNMVKLGSLYNCNGKQPNGSLSTSSLSGSRYELLASGESARDQRDRLEFNQRLQEQRLLAEERRDWDRLSPDHGQLQAKVQQLYKLDQLLQEESGTLHSLQQNKELLEKALGGLRHKMQNCSRNNPAEAERYREQQLLLERELSRVRLLLAHNSKKLEETVAENARLEQDLVVLRQKLQASRRYAGNVQQPTTPRDSTSGTSAALEKELRRVQQLVGDLQRQRQELSVQVKQLTEKSHSLVQQIKPQASSTPQVHQSSKKRTPSSWLETDLDSGMTREHSSPAASKMNGRASPYHHPPYQQQQPLTSPQYVKDLSACSPASTSSSSSSRYCSSGRQVQGQSSSPQNGINSLTPQLREQIQQHQLKQQLLKDQMQGKSNSPVQQQQQQQQNNNNVPLYVNAMVPDPRRLDRNNYEHVSNGGPLMPPEYIPPPPPPPCEETIMMNGGYGHDDGKFAGLMQNREKQEIKTVRIVKRESERRQRDRGDRGTAASNGQLTAPGGAKRLGEEDYGGSQQFELQLDRVIEETQPMIHAQSSGQLTELDDVQFQRSMSLPRGFGGQKPNHHQQAMLLQQQQMPVPPPPRSDSMTALRNMIAKRHRVRLDHHQDTGSSDSTLSPYTDSPTYSNYQNYPPPPPLQQHQQQSNYWSPPYSPPIRPYPVYGNIQQCYSGSTSSVVMSPEPSKSGSTEVLSQSQQSLNGQLSPVFKSEAAKQIIKEMTEKKPDRLRRRQVPREKRRHYTVSSSKPLRDLEDSFAKMGMGRARDDLDMERALRPRINAPDVVRSTLSHKELKYNESTIDSLLGTPNKIFIPERYVPEKTPELTAEEKEQRLKKAESIRKMLSETTIASSDGADDEPEKKKKVAEEKRQREHILQLNQILAKQVMEKSKMVAANARSTLSLNADSSIDDDDISPLNPLPLYQQRENFYS